MKLDLTGRRVLVTGASRGIGKAIAVALGGAGATVAAHGFRNAAGAASTAKAAGNDSFGLVANLEEPGAVEQLFEQAIARLGGLDVLVNNAGIALDMPLGMPDEEWKTLFDRTMAVNVRAAELLSRKAIRLFTSQGGGRLIHIASRAAFRGDTADCVAYAASKGAMVAMSRSFARAYGKDGIASFVIAPGWVRTDMAADHIAAKGEEQVVADQALNRMTEPGDIAPMVVLLASGLADHATGTSIDINAASYVR